MTTTTNSGVRVMSLNKGSSSGANNPQKTTQFQESAESFRLVIEPYSSSSSSSSSSIESPLTKQMSAALELLAQRCWMKQMLLLLFLAFQCPSRAARLACPLLLESDGQSNREGTEDGLTNPKVERIQRSGAIEFGWCWWYYGGIVSILCVGNQDGADASATHWAR